MGRKEIPLMNRLLEIPCLRRGCDFTSMVHLETYGEDERGYKLYAIKKIINQLKDEHEAGKHMKPACTHTCTCHYLSCRGCCRV